MDTIRCVTCYRPRGNAYVCIPCNEPEHITRYLDGEYGARLESVAREDYQGYQDVVIVTFKGAQA